MKKNAFLILPLMAATSSLHAAGYTMCDTTSCKPITSVTATSDYAATKYPVVLAHGIFGTNQTNGAPKWYQIPEDLAANGANIYIPKVTAVASVYVRGEQLLKQLETISAITGAPKLNLIGHSQGGLNIRYVMGIKPELVASVTTIGTPHTGTKLADYLSSSSNTSASQRSFAIYVANVLGQLVDRSSGDSTTPQNAQANIDELTTANAKVFASKFPAGLPEQACGEGVYTYKSIPLFSWSGTSVSTNRKDYTDLLLSITSSRVQEKNDGIVGQCSSHFGKVLRDNYAQNHLDETNQVRGLVNAAAEPKALFRQQLNRLKSLGL